MAAFSTFNGDTSVDANMPEPYEDSDSEDFVNYIEQNFSFCYDCFSLFAGEQGLDDFSRTSDYQFKPSLKALQQSADDGCPFCAIVLSQVPVDDSAKVHTLDAFDDSLPSNQQDVRFSVWYRPEDPDYYEHMRPATFQLQFWFPNRFQLKRINFLVTNIVEVHCFPICAFVCTASTYGFLDALEFDYSFNLAGDTSSDRTWNQAQQWLDQCINTHTGCNKYVQSDRELPTRLIDIGDSGNSDHVCVRNSLDINPASNYVTLSHCWGTLRLPRLTKHSLAYMKSSIAISELPRTFQDAITIARRLRERYHTRYLWIDSLCIIQDCAEDWQREASRMGEVYKYALCNIAATAAPDSTYGCFRNKSGHSATGCSLWIDCEGLPNGVFHCLPEDLWEDKISSAPLNRRAWVVQERLLSPRILHFGADQLYFECCETSACETCPAGLEGDIAPTSKKLELSLCPLPYKLAFDFRRSGEQSDDHLLKFLHAWSEVVTTYSEGKLTREEDKLVALSGLAKEMKSRFCGDIEYLAGLWRQDLAAQLLWSVISKGRKYSLPTTQAPSWSWASIDGLILAGSGTRPDEITLMSVLEAKVNSNGFDTMVHNHDGQLRVKGRLFRAEIAPENPRDLRFSLRRGYVQGTALIACRLDVPTTIRKCGPNIHLMPVKYDWFNKSLKGLILEPTQVVKGQFQRYGTFSASEGSLNTFNNSHEKEEVEYEVYDGINEFVITII